MSIFDSFRKFFQRPQEIRMPRRWPRIVMTDATVVSLSGGQRQPVKLTNLSAGGARIVSSFALGSQEKVTLTVPLGSGSRKDLPAEVVYCKRDEHSLYYSEGLSFLSAGRDGVEEISSFIEEERRRRSGAGEMWQG
jgi:hypothetical protein